MSLTWRHSITVTRYGTEQRDARNRLVAPAVDSTIDIPKCLVQAYKRGRAGFQMPEGRKEEEYVIYSGPTELLTSRHKREKRRPDTFYWDDEEYTVVSSMKLNADRITDCFYAVAELRDNPTKADP